MPRSTRVSSGALERGTCAGHMSCSWLVVRSRHRIVKSGSALLHMQPRRLTANRSAEIGDLVTVKFILRFALGVAVVALLAWLIGAATARADQQGSGSTPLPPPVTVTATPPPAPGPASASESHTGSSYPGNSCVLRLGTRNAPSAPSNTFNWSQSGDTGWPYGWAGLAPANAVPTTPPTVGCSR